MGQNPAGNESRALSAGQGKEELVMELTTKKSQRTQKQIKIQRKHFWDC